MKTCPKCSDAKPLSAFNKANNRRDGVQVYCRLCQRKVDKDFYDRTPSRKEKVRGSCAAARGVAREYVLAYLLSHPCIDCGETDIVVLDFDHIRDKIRPVSEMVTAGFALKTIRSEIEKCEVRCANCHRRMTARRHGGWWKLLLPGDE